MWISTDFNVVINLDNVKTIEYEEDKDSMWAITAHFMDGDERLIGHVTDEIKATNRVSSILANTIRLLEA